MDLRPATVADLADEFDVFEQAERELHERRGGAWAHRAFSKWSGFIATCSNTTARTASSPSKAAG